MLPRLPHPPRLSFQVRRLISLHFKCDSDAVNADGVVSQIRKILASRGTSGTPGPVPADGDRESSAAEEEDRDGDDAREVDARDVAAGATKGVASGETPSRRRDAVSVSGGGGMGMGDEGAGGRREGWHPP